MEHFFAGTCLFAVHLEWIRGHISIYIVYNFDSKAILSSYPDLFDMGKWGMGRGWGEGKGGGGEIERTVAVGTGPNNIDIILEPFDRDDPIQTSPILRSPRSYRKIWPPVPNTQRYSVELK